MIGKGKGAEAAKHATPKLYELPIMVLHDAEARKELLAVIGACMAGVGALYLIAAMRIAGWM